MRTPRCSQINTAQPAPAIEADDYLKLLMGLAGAEPEGSATKGCGSAKISNISLGVAMTEMQVFVKSLMR
jgi:hypothetical protein